MNYENYKVIHGTNRNQFSRPASQDIKGQGAVDDFAYSPQRDRKLDMMPQQHGGSPTQLYTYRAPDGDLKGPVTVYQLLEYRNTDVVGPKMMVQAQGDKAWYELQYVLAGLTLDHVYAPPPPSMQADDGRSGNEQAYTQKQTMKSQQMGYADVKPDLAVRVSSSRMRSDQQHCSHAYSPMHGKGDRGKYQPQHEAESDSAVPSDIDLGLTKISANVGKVLFTGNKISLADRPEWCYIDDHKNPQGPYSAEDMLGWLQNKYLKAQLKICAVKPREVQQAPANHALYHQMKDLLLYVENGGEPFMYSAQDIAKGIPKDLTDIKQRRRGPAMGDQRSNGMGGRGGQYGGMGGSYGGYSSRDDRGGRDDAHDGGRRERGQYGSQYGNGADYNGGGRRYYQDGRERGDRDRHDSRRGRGGRYGASMSHATNQQGTGYRRDTKSSDQSNASFARDGSDQSSFDSGKYQNRARGGRAQRGRGGRGGRVRGQLSHEDDIHQNIGNERSTYDAGNMSYSNRGDDRRGGHDGQWGDGSRDSQNRSGKFGGGGHSAHSNHTGQWGADGDTQHDSSIGQAQHSREATIFNGQCGGSESTEQADARQSKVGSECDREGGAQAQANRGSRVEKGSIHSGQRSSVEERVDGQWGASASNEGGETTEQNAENTSQAQQPDGSLSGLNKDTGDQPKVSTPVVPPAADCLSPLGQSDLSTVSAQGTPCNPADDSTTDRGGDHKALTSTTNPLYENEDKQQSSPQEQGKVAGSEGQASGTGPAVPQGDDNHDKDRENEPQSVQNVQEQLSVAVQVADDAGVSAKEDVKVAVSLPPVIQQSNVAAEHAIPCDVKDNAQSEQVTDKPEQEVSNEQVEVQT